MALPPLVRLTFVLLCVANLLLHWQLATQKHDNKMLSEKNEVLEERIQQLLQKESVRKTLDDLVPLDVVPLSLGIANFDGTMNVLIKRNTKLPVKRVTMILLPIENGKNSTEPIRIFEGEHLLAEKNRLLAEFALEGPFSPGEQLQVELSIAINADRLFRVVVLENSTHTRNGFTVFDYKNRLIFKDEVQHLVSEARGVRMEENIEMERRTARKKLEDFCKSIMAQLESYKVDNKNGEGEGIFEADAKQMRVMCTEVLNWLLQNSDGKTEDFERLHRELADFHAQISAVSIPSGQDLKIIINWSAFIICFLYYLGILILFLFIVLTIVGFVTCCIALVLWQVYPIS